MTSAVEPVAERAGVRTIVGGGAVLGIVVAAGVAVFALLSRALTGTQRDRLRARGLRTTVVIVAAESRSQWQNRRIAREKLAAALRQALAPPSASRRPTRPTRGAQERRLAAKRRRSETKRLRRRPEID